MKRERVIAYKPAYAHLWGVEAGVLLSQILFYSDRTRDPEGWIEKSSREFQSETGLTRRQFEKARRVLTEAGVLCYRLKGIPPVSQYRVNRVRLQEYLNELRQQEKGAFMEVHETHQETARSLREEVRQLMEGRGYPQGVINEALQRFSALALLRTLKTPVVGDPQIRQYLERINNAPSSV